MRILLTSFATALVALALVACGAEGKDDDSGAKPDTATAAVAADFAERFIIAKAPGDPISATDVREYGVDEAEVITTGRIESFVDGFAVMTIVDLAVEF